MSIPDIEAAALELRPDDDGRISLSIAISLKRIADLLEVVRADSGEVITLPQLLLRISQTLDRTLETPDCYGRNVTAAESLMRMADK